jgi:DNA-binding NtrC family response regulator
MLEALGGGWMAAARVLVVDDEPAVLGLVSKALSLQGYEVHAVPSPLEALKLMHDTPCFDLVVSDVIMPEMCGPELVKKVAELCPTAAVVVMSAHINVHEMAVQFDGMTRLSRVKFLSKPFRVTDLYSAVEKALAPSP